MADIPVLVDVEVHIKELAWVINFYVILKGVQVLLHLPYRFNKFGDLEDNYFKIREELVKGMKISIIKKGNYFFRNKSDLLESEEIG